MKNTLFIIGLFFISIGTAQSLEDSLNENNFKTNIEENHFFKKSNNNVVFEKITSLETTEEKTNLENKFSMNDVFDKSFSEAYKKSIKENSSSIIAITSNELITKMVTNILITKKIRLNDAQNESLNNADKSLITHKKYPSNKDVLNINTNINKTINIELGNNIFRDLNKIYRSEIDNTLNNSLNLLTLNF